MESINLVAARFRRFLTVVTAVVVLLCMNTPMWAQYYGNENRAVGGVSIDAEGALQSAATESLGLLGKQRLEALEEVPGELKDGVEMRKVSLRGIEAAIQRAAKDNQPIPQSVQFLAGLQRIEYVFVYPEKQDIVLVGPGEGWRVDGRGNMVGIKSGRAVLLLDDLLVALRSAKAAAQGGIRCSIDPTQEGLVRLNKQVSGLKTMGNPETTTALIEEALGAQQITVSGVPADSHFARVIVAADYRMKRIAMGFEPSPVKGIPSFLQLISGGGRGMSNMLPRWWLEPQYEPIVRDVDGLAWQLRGASVKAMTEEDFLTEGGQREHTGKANPMAQRWADSMTAKYSDLAVAEPIFGELQNCMELAIVSALIVKERLAEKAGASLSGLFDESSVKPLAFAVPKTVSSKASLLKKGRNWVISASGGVLINSWAIADKTTQGDAPAKARAKASAEKQVTWWWN